MTAEADIIRDRRRAFARPGGFHDRLIGFLAKALPAAIGVVVAITNQRIAVSNASYRGEDDHGRPFVLTAGRAVQPSPQNPLVHMQDLVAKMKMKDGPAVLKAPQGVFNFDTQNVAVDGPVNFQAADGYHMQTHNVAINLRTRTAVGSGGVTGSVPTGTFRADSLHADLNARTVTLQGHARLRMTPGQMRMPQ
jgi:lipopolysaccharide export system protein LptC